MQATAIETFYETLGFCFDTTLGDILGTAVRDSVYMLLEKNGLPRRDVPSRFDDAMRLMSELLGSCSRVVAQRTVVEMYKQYSQRVQFSYWDSLKDQLSVLKESVITNHLAPRREWENINFDSLQQLTVIDSLDKDTTPHAYNSLYRLKKGLKSQVPD